MVDDEQPTSVPFELTGVPETLLWNLHHRAAAARDPRSGLVDPLAIEIVERLDYSADRVVSGQPGAAAQWHAVRVRTFDDELRRLLRERPDATVVCLGEGLETQFWRVDNGRVRWLSVDLPETIALRRRLLPEHPRVTMVIGSATTDGWTVDVDRTRPVIVTAQGLLMYFDRSEVHRTIGMIADRLPGAAFIFDAVPAPMQRARERWGGAAQSNLPAWTWTISAQERQSLAALPTIERLVELIAPRGRGAFSGVVLPVLRRLPAVRGMLPLFPVFRADLAQARRPSGDQ